MERIHRNVKRGTALLLVVLFSFFLHACGGGGGSSAAALPPEDPNPYLPTDTSNKLYYDDSPFPVSFIGKKLIGYTWVDVLSWASGAKEYYSIDGDSISWRGLYSPMMFSADDGYYSADFKLYDDFLLWSSSMVAGDYAVISGKGVVDIAPLVGSAALDFSGYRIFHGLETVTVPLGTFEALHVSFQISLMFTMEGYNFSIPFSGEFWFAEGVGIVKRNDNGYVVKLTNFEGADKDGDDVADVLDVFPDDPSEAYDNDGDSLGDNADEDDDNDGAPDLIDALPMDALETRDFDHDGIGDNADLNDDNDAAPDLSDVFPYDSREWIDTDNDGTGNNADTDDDNDGWIDADEIACSSNSLSAGIVPSDTDADRMCNKVDTDDDNDSYLDTVDVFPLDINEWSDTDNDGQGNNADTDDDNDTITDLDDPQSLNSLVPGRIYTAAPVVVAGVDTRVVLSGANFSSADTFFVNGVAVSATVISKNTVEINLSNPEAGSIDIAIRYSGYSYQSTVSIPAVAPVYYPYAVISDGGRRLKNYFDPVTQSLYAYTQLSGSGAQNLTRFRYAGRGGWQDEQVSLVGMLSYSVSPDRKYIYVLRNDDSLVEIDMDTFSPGIVKYPQTNNYYDISGIEFDYSNKMILTTYNYKYTYDLEPQSQTYNKVVDLGNFNFNCYISPGASGDGTFFVFGSTCGTTSSPSALVQYNPLTNIVGFVTAKSYYASSSSNIDGSKMVINGYNIYDKNFSLIGQIGDQVQPVANVVIDREGQFIIRAGSSDKTLYWYDASDLHGQLLLPEYSALFTEQIGNVRSVALSHDGLTLFVFGDTKTLVIPVWQIRENAIGSPAVCPAAGCNGVSIAEGMPQPGSSEIIIPPFDDEVSPIDHLAPTYAGQGHRFEILLGGHDFKPASVVMFGDTPATVRYVNDTELRVMIPDLPAGRYLVTVDGHQQNAPDFHVIAPQNIATQLWSVSGTSVEMIYDAISNALYNLDVANGVLSRIDFSDNTITSQSISAAKDLTWCQEDGYLYVANGTNLQQYNADTLQFVKNIVAVTSDRVECVYGGNLVLIKSSGDWLRVYNPDTAALESVISMSSSIVDGVASIGEKVYLGGTSSNAGRVKYDALLKKATIFPNAGSFSTSSWSDDGSLGVVNNSVVYNKNFEVLGTLDVPVTAQAVVVSPDGTTIFVASGTVFSSRIYKIVIDPSSPTDFSVDSSYPVFPSLGTIRRMEVSLDGNTVFVSTNNSIISVAVD